MCVYYTVAGGSNNMLYMNYDICGFTLCVLFVLNICFGCSKEDDYFTVFVQIIFNISTFQHFNISNRYQIRKETKILT